MYELLLKFNFFSNLQLRTLLKDLTVETPVPGFKLTTY